MPSFKQQNLGKSDSSTQGRGHNLWYYQQRGDRYYFRLAPLGLAILIIPIIVSLAAIIALFFYWSNTPIKHPDIKITTLPAPTNSSTKSVIKPAPPPPTPPRVPGRLGANSDNSAAVPQPTRNINAQ